MSRTIVTYETFHGSAKKIAEVISNRLNCKCINIDTPFEAENLQDIDNIILVFNFRGPYTAQLNKLYLNIESFPLGSKNTYSTSSIFLISFCLKLNSKLSILYLCLTISL